MLSLFGLFMLLARLVDGASILIYPFGHCLNSHLLHAERIANILVDDGYEVSMLTSSAYKKFETNQQQYVQISSKVRLIEFICKSTGVTVCELDTIEYYKNVSIKKRYDHLIRYFVQYCDALLSDVELLVRLKSTNFTAFIFDTLDPCGRVLADYLDVPVIALVSTGLGHFDMNRRPPSYLPAPNAAFSIHMSFMQRVENFLLRLVHDVIPMLVAFDAPFEQLRRHHGLNSTLPLSEQRISLTFVNSNFAVDYAAPIAPDTVLIGGLSHRYQRPLPEELAQFMAGAKEGVIVVSFGSLIKHFDAEWTRKFADAFARLPQRIVWRANSDTQVSDNVLRMSWIPQLEVLAHNNTRLFITHCGLNAIYETVHTARPIIALPFSGDQFEHAQRLVTHHQLGVELNVFTMTSTELYEAIRTVLDNPVYTQNAQRTSIRLHDQPMSPQDTIKYWVGYVTRHTHVDHLTPFGHKLFWFQYFSLDVIAFLMTAVIILAVFVVCLVMRTVKLIYKLLRTGAAPFIKKSKQS